MAGLDELPGYAELVCTSNFTFLEGASHPEELVQQASELGYQALALTDECSVAGVVRAHEEARRHGLALLVGSRLRLSGESALAGLELVLLCMNRRGYGDLCELITLARSRAEKGSYHLEPDDFVKPAGVTSEWACLQDVLVVLLPNPLADTETLTTQLSWAAALFPGRLWCGVVRRQLAHEFECLPRLRAQAAQLELPCVAVGHVYMHRRSRKPMQDVLRAIRQGQAVAACGYGLEPNAEAHLRPRVRLAQLYPATELAATLEIARRCRFSLDELRYEYPEEGVPAGLTPGEYLRQEARLGAARRYPQGMPSGIAGKLEKELDLVIELGYEAYFLTVYQLVQFARSRGILCQGRGSAANSVLCYCLGITAADPERMAALFERFISRERNEPPDIDIDFEHQRREEVIQHLYQRYGRQRAALTAVVITYRTPSVLRDTGKALGIAPSVIEAVVRAHPRWASRSELSAAMACAGLDPDSGLLATWLHLVQVLHGFPRHLSQHPGGFVLSRGPLSRLVPIENAAMVGRSVVQWDKDDLDAVGLLKVDVLGLGMLTVLRRALELVSRQRGQELALHQIPQECPATYRMISQADTIGLFQIESRAQMSMLPRLQPRTYYDLVIQVAIVRPGPIQGGMVHPYLRRRQGLEPAVLPRPELEPALGRTLGVPIFQEQVMQVAMLAAGFSPGQADSLRRAMAAWRRKGGLEPFREALLKGMEKHGYERSFAEALFRQIQGFGEYGFPESHAASFALLAYASAWLKCHYPAAYLVALLNSQPMGFYAPAQLVQDARRHGVVVLPVDVCHSQWEAELVLASGADPAVRLGLKQIKGLQQGQAERLVRLRTQQPWRSITDLVQRAELDGETRRLLAAAGALRSLSDHRRQAAWEVAAPAAPQLLVAAADEDEERKEEPPLLPSASEAHEIVADYRTQGLSLGRHPLALLRAGLALRGVRHAAELAGQPNGRWLKACGLVVGRQRPGTAGGTVFVTLEDETGLVNVIVWPDLAERQRRELLSARLMMVAGQWQVAHGVAHLVARRLFDWSAELGPLATRSRDFR